MVKKNVLGEVQAVTKGPVFILTVTEGYLAELLGLVPVDPTGGGSVLVVRAVSYVGQTGRRNEFAAGKIPTGAEIEVYPPDAVQCIPLAQVVSWGEWPGKLPTKTQ